MIPAMIAWLATVVGPRAAKPVAIAAGILLLIAALLIAKTIYDHRLIAAHDKQAEAEAITKAAPADANAAAQRVEDTKILANQQQELDNAVSHATGSDDARRRSGCTILRQQGQPLPPACS